MYFYSIDSSDIQEDMKCQLVMEEGRVGCWMDLNICRRKYGMVRVCLGKELPVCVHAYAHCTPCI